MRKLKILAGIFLFCAFALGMANISAHNFRKNLLGDHVVIPPKNLVVEKTTGGYNVTWDNENGLMGIGEEVKKYTVYIVEEDQQWPDTYIFYTSNIDPENPGFFIPWDRPLPSKIAIQTHPMYGSYRTNEFELDYPD